MKSLYWPHLYHSPQRNRASKCQAIWFFPPVRLLCDVTVSDLSYLSEQNVFLLKIYPDTCKGR